SVPRPVHTPTYTPTQEILAGGQAITNLVLGAITATAGLTLAEANADDASNSAAVSGASIAATALGLTGAPDPDGKDKCRKRGKGKDGLRPENHHYATDKNKRYKEEMHDIAAEFGLGLDEA